AYYGKTPQEIFYQALSGMTGGVEVYDKEAAYRSLGEEFGTGILGLYTYRIDGEEERSYNHSFDVTMTSTKRAQWGGSAGYGDSLMNSIRDRVFASFDGTMISHEENDRIVQEAIRGLLTEVVAGQTSNGEITTYSETYTLNMVAHPTLGYVIANPMNLIFNCMLPGAVVSFR
ncbi:MAG: hypothetical protein LBM60_00760, partial [Clostridium sp.]|nr:hypothetical protein [Clostridium sp.]